MVEEEDTNVLCYLLLQVWSCRTLVHDLFLRISRQYSGRNDYFQNFQIPVIFLQNAPFQSSKAIDITME